MIIPVKSIGSCRRKKSKDQLYSQCLLSDLTGGWLYPVQTTSPRHKRLGLLTSDHKIKFVYNCVLLLLFFVFCLCFLFYFIFLIFCLFIWLFFSLFCFFPFLLFFFFFFCVNHVCNIKVYGMDFVRDTKMISQKYLHGFRASLPHFTPFFTSLTSYISPLPAYNLHLFKREALYRFNPALLSLFSLGEPLKLFSSQREPMH